MNNPSETILQSGRKFNDKTSGDSVPRTPCKGTSPLDPCLESRICAIRNSRIFSPLVHVKVFCRTFFQKSSWGSGQRPENFLRRESLLALIFLAPSLIGISVFFLLPFVDTVRRSFFDVRGVNFIGWESYSSVVGNAAFRLAAVNTVRFVGVSIPLLMVVSLGVALLVRAVKGRVFKTTFLLPMAVPVASIVLLWQALFNYGGLANAALIRFGGAPVDFMHSGAAFWVLVFTYLWKNTGYNMILWLAGLDGISGSLYEAAYADGAGRLQCFRYITLPCLLPTIGVVAILSLLNSFRVFREAYLVAGSHPHDSMYLLQHLFNNWFQNLDISRLSAGATMMAAVLLIIILLMRKFLDGDSDG